MLPPKTLQRYISQLDEVLQSNNINQAKELQKEILAALGADLDGLKRGYRQLSGESDWITVEENPNWAKCLMVKTIRL